MIVKWTSFIRYVLLVTVVPFFFYIIDIWSETQQLYLEEIKSEILYLRNNYERRVYDDITERIKGEFFADVKEGIDEVFTPDKKEDHFLKYQMKYATRDEIQIDFTTTIREGMQQSFPDIIKNVVQDYIENYHLEKVYSLNLCGSNKKLPTNQKVLTYTLFGTRQLYFDSIPKILQEAVASNLYHDWRIRIYHDALQTPDVPTKYMHYKNIDFCDVRNLPKYGNISDVFGKFWRNMPLGDESVDVMCSRDLDSALLTREEHAVRAFLRSNKYMHIMRDFQTHDAGIMAGMWCIKIWQQRTRARHYLENILNRGKNYKARTDQPVLDKVIFYNSFFSRDFLQHDSYFCKRFSDSVPFPTKRQDAMEFVGCPNHVCDWKGVRQCPIKCRPKEHLDWEYC